MTKLVEIDVWHEGTDEELAALLKSAPGQALDGHAGFVCTHAVIEESGPIAQETPPPRLATADEVDRFKNRPKGHPEWPGRLLPGPANAPRLIEPITPPPLPGKKRLRLNYRGSG